MCFGDLGCDIGDMFIRLDVELKKLDTSGQLARLKVLQGGIASFGGASAQEDMVGASSKQLAHYLETNTAVCWRNVSFERENGLIATYLL